MRKMDLPSGSHTHPGERSEEEDVCEWCQRGTCMGVFGMHYKQWRQNRRWCQCPETRARAFSLPGCSSYNLVVLSQSRVQLFVTPWTVALQAPLSMGFPRQEYWCGLPFPSPGDLLNPETEPKSPVYPALAGGFFTTEPPGKPRN